ncbi:TonB-dependent receptor plug domain-containing protein [Desulfospira joergensenii]|uniref:TonB-dependent receptor plug domain-containing protein n=1 Tax=Desulfospira joergensenii TaxID=53329 RepID=UPI001FC9A2B1|nr:TonB-dependent receptor [Desulfospira joergensenii]
MDEVIVSATKTEESRKDISNSTLVIDDLDLEDSPAQGIGDLIGGELGIDWRTRGDFGGAGQELHIRGMGGDGTQVLINGLTVNSPSLGTSNIGKLSITNIERIEVVKGSGSVLYGSGAMGGIVNIITKSPKEGQTDLAVSAGYGTEDTYQVSAENGLFLNDHFGYYITADLFGTDGFRDNADAEQKNGSFKCIYKNENDFQISLYGDIVDKENGNPGPVPPDGTPSFSVNGIPFYNSESANLLSRAEEQDTHLIFKIEADPLEWIGINLQADFTDMESDNISRYYDSFSPGNLPGSHSIVTNEVIGMEGNLDIHPLDNGTLLVGFQYKEYDWESQSETLDGYGNVASTLTGKNSLHSTGLYAELHYRPIKYLKGTLGIRQEDHSVFGSETLPRFGLVLNPTDSTVIKFNTGKHFKAPTPNDLFWPYEDWGWGSGTQGNSGLKPETGMHSDIGIEQSLLDNKIFASLTYFKWDIDDKIEWVPDASYFYTPENLSKYEASGIEAGLKFGPFYNTDLSLSYTKTDATEEKEGGAKRQARYTPDDFFKAAVTRWFDCGLDITAVYRYTSKRPAIYTLDTDSTPAQTLSSYYTIDIKANQRLSDNWTFSCQVNNLLDENYDTYVQTFYDSSGVGTLSPYRGAGRSFFASMKYSF